MNKLTEFTRYASNNDKFSRDDIKQLTVYGPAAFNKSRLYLSEELVEVHMGYKKGKSAMSDFIKKHILNSTKFEQDVDYWIVTADDELVTSYYHSDYNRNGITNPNHGNRKQFIVITGKTFKHLIMNADTDKGDDMRDYYVRLEEMVSEWREYCENENEERIQQLEDDNKKMLTEKQRMQRSDRAATALTNIMKMKCTKTIKDELFYLMTTIDYGSDGIRVFKIGKTIRAPNRRPSGLNTASAFKEDDFVVIFQIYTHDATALENRMFQILKPLRVKDKREFVFGSSRLLKNVIQYVADNLDEDNEYFNDIIEELISQFKSKTFDPLEEDDKIKLGIIPDSKLIEEKKEVAPQIEFNPEGKTRKEIKVEHTKRMVQERREREIKEKEEVAQAMELLINKCIKDHYPEYVGKLIKSELHNTPAIKVEKGVIMKYVSNAQQNMKSISNSIWTNALGVYKCLFNLEVL